MNATPPAEPAEDPPVLLVVDNEEGILEVCRDALERIAPPPRIVLEGSSPAAARRLASERYDLLLTNLNMPEVSGLRLLELARRLAPEMPVLVLTGYPTAETAWRCRELGAVDYVPKPFHPDDLIVRVRRALAE